MKAEWNQIMVYLAVIRKLFGLGWKHSHEKGWSLESSEPEFEVAFYLGRVLGQFFNRKEASA